MKYALMLNDMRQPNIENLQAVRVADDPGELRAWYEQQQCEPWMDGRWRKSFKPGSDLEWFNPENLDGLNGYWGGIWESPDYIQAGDGVFKAGRG